MSGINLLLQQNQVEISSLMDNLSKWNPDILLATVELRKRYREGLTFSEIPFLYEAESIITSPGSMFTFEELNNAIEPYVNEAGEGEDVLAIAFHGNLINLNSSKGFNDGSYHPDNDIKVKVSSYIENLFDSGIQVSGPNEFISEVKCNLTAMGFEIPLPTDEQVDQNCAVLKTPFDIWLASIAYTKVWDKGDCVSLYLEDSSLAIGADGQQRPDRIYKINVDENLGLNIEEVLSVGLEQPKIKAKIVAGCVDETAGIQDFARAENPHNAKIVTIGSREDPFIEMFLRSGHELPSEPGFASMHFLHARVLGEDGAFSYSNPTESTRHHFPHLIEAIARNNNGIADIVIEEGLMAEYAALIEELYDIEEIQMIRLTIISPDGGLSVCTNNTDEGLYLSLP